MGNEAALTTLVETAWAGLSARREQARRGEQPPEAPPKTAIGEHVSRLCREEYGDRLRAIVLTGSLARGEATFLRKDRRWILLGDAEFLLIFRGRFRLPRASRIFLLKRRVEESLARSGIECSVTLSPAHPGYLAGLAPHIFAYELRTCGRVVWGDAGILSLIPAFRASDIPLEDAWRLLCNRIVEQLEAAGELASGEACLSPAASYRTVKLCLDMATSFLLFVGIYAPTYRGRQQRLEELARASRAANALPFSLTDFARLVAVCTELKLANQGVWSQLGRRLWVAAATHAQLLWRWELSRLTGASLQSADQELLDEWMRLQPYPRRLRGWLYVVRKAGWHRSCRAWPRWLRQAWRASPRYWVYSAACALFFKLPFLPDASNRALREECWEELRSRLPVASRPSGQERIESPNQLAADVIFNYRQFLVETRA